MTLFDLIAIGVILVSGLVGFTRGAVRELVTVFAFTLSALAALYLLPVVGPFARHTVHPTWAANAAAIVSVFIVAYIALRIAAHWVTSRLHEQTALGAIDRTIGLCFGVVRALVLLGLFYLVFSMATPAELAPSWIVDAKLYPLARASGRIIGAAAPHALKASSHIGPALERAVVSDGQDDNETETATPVPQPATSEPAHSEEDRPAPERSAAQKPARKAPGYDKRSRDDIDALVERSR